MAVVGQESYPTPVGGSEVGRRSDANGGRQRRYLPEDAQVGSKTDARVGPKTRASEAKEW